MDGRNRGMLPAYAGRQLKSTIHVEQQLNYQSSGSIAEHLLLHYSTSN